VSDANHGNEPDLLARLSSKVAPSWRCVNFHIDYVGRLCDEGYIPHETLEAFLTLLETRFRAQQQRRPLP
jgi:hypothetical protein